MNKLIIIATYNEISNITDIIDMVFTVMPDIDILVIDDNSPDGTATVVQLLILNKYSQQLFLLQRSHKLGLGTAYIAGFHWALARSYTMIAHLDADFSHDPQYLPAMFALLPEYDLIIGSRYIHGGGIKNWSLRRKILSRGGNLYAKWILGVPIADLTSGMKCFSRQAIQHLCANQLQASGYAFQIETTYKTIFLGLAVREIPIVFVDRTAGSSKMSGNIFKEAILMVWKLRFATNKHS